MGNEKWKWEGNEGQGLHRRGKWGNENLEMAPVTSPSHYKGREWEMGTREWKWEGKEGLKRQR